MGEYNSVDWKNIESCLAHLCRFFQINIIYICSVLFKYDDLNYVIDLISVLLIRIPKNFNQETLILLKYHHDS
jgi:hypothetical protein